ncbi:MAG: hypothetical protein WDA32_08550, partial [Candidatus Caldatribacteriota bacterium]
SGFDSSISEIQFSYPAFTPPLGGVSACNCSITANISIGECSGQVTFGVTTMKKTIEQFVYSYSYSISVIESQP